MPQLPPALASELERRGLMPPTTGGLPPALMQEMQRRGLAPATEPPAPPTAPPLGPEPARAVQPREHPASTIGEGPGNRLMPQDRRRLRREHFRRERDESRPGALWEAASNLPRSVAGVARDLTAPIHSPVQTATGLYGLGKGLISMLVPGEQPSEENVRAVGRFLGERYGSPAGVAKTFREDPAGLAADLSGILMGGSTLALKAAGTAGRLGQAAQAAGTAGRALNVPGHLVAGATAAGRPVARAVGRAAARGLGRTTREGRRPFETAYLAGRDDPTGTAAMQAVRREDVPLDDIVHDVREGITEQQRQLRETRRSAEGDLEAAVAGRQPRPQDARSATGQAEAMMYDEHGFQRELTEGQAAGIRASRPAGRPATPASATELPAPPRTLDQPPDPTGYPPAASGPTPPPVRRAAADQPLPDTASGRQGFLEGGMDDLDDVQIQMIENALDELEGAGQVPTRGALDQADSVYQAAKAEGIIPRRWNAAKAKWEEALPGSMTAEELAMIDKLLSQRGVQNARDPGPAGWGEEARAGVSRHGPGDPPPVHEYPPVPGQRTQAPTPATAAADTPAGTRASEDDRIMSVARRILATRDEASLRAAAHAANAEPDVLMAWAGNVARRRQMTELGQRSGEVRRQQRDDAQPVDQPGVRQRVAELARRAAEPVREVARAVGDVGREVGGRRADIQAGGGEWRSAGRDTLTSRTQAATEASTEGIQRVARKRVNFNPVKLAVDEVLTKTFQGMNLNRYGGPAQSRIKAALNRWQNAKPSNFHTVAGMHAFLNEMKAISASPLARGQQSALAREAQDAARTAIREQMPSEYLEYFDRMDRADRNLVDTAKSLSATEGSGAETAMAKIQRAWRDPRSSGRFREQMLAGLSDTVPNLDPRLAGLATSSWLPRSHAYRTVMAGGAVGGGLISPGLALAALAASPRVMGEVATAAGRIAGATRPARQAATSPLAALAAQQAGQATGEAQFAELARVLAAQGR